VVFLTFASAALLSAHHSLGNHDTTKAVRVKGTILQYHAINPHSIIYLEEKGTEGQIRRWAIEGPSVLQINRDARGKNVLKPGIVIEACGYLPKEAIVWQIPNPDPNAASIAGRLLTAEVLTLPDGTLQQWGDYGFHKCYPPGFTDQHSPRSGQ
jgi:hypothetical protein